VLSRDDRVYVLEKGTVRHSGASSGLGDDKALLDKLPSL
jgi:ABC-type branched-subunit amino acid transport system ATPase component